MMPEVNGRQIAKHRDELLRRVRELETENAQLREAAQHYMCCDNCNSRFICVEGQILAQKAKMDFKNAKAV